MNDQFSLLDEKKKKEGKVLMGEWLESVRWKIKDL